MFFQIRMRITCIICKLMFVSYESGNVVHRGEMQLTIVEKSVDICGVGPAGSNIPNAQRKEFA
jgi:hypothetical protein